MLSKNKIKLIKSLDTRKGRVREGLFVAEGHKLVGELLAAMRPVYIAATPEGYERLVQAGATNAGEDASVDIIAKAELTKASLLQTPQDVIALFPIPHHDADLARCAETGLCLALDDVQDPGNLGTIVRLCDWFGIGDVFCSEHTADIYNPKAVQATMGALAHVGVHYVDLARSLGSLPASVPVFGTAMNGQVIWETPLSSNGIIVMGNEGNGVSAEIQALCTQHLFIPRYPADASGTESLNVAMATGIVLSEFRRRHFQAP